MSDETIFAAWGALARWLCEHHGDRVALIQLAERAGVSATLLREPAEPAVNVDDLLAAVQRHRLSDELLRAIWGRGRRIRGRRGELLAIAAGLGVDDLAGASLADGDDEFAPLLAAQAAAWSGRTALRGGYDVQLARLYVEPSLAIPGHHGRHPLATWLERGVAGPRWLVVFGEVGSGKTELLHKTAAHLAERARGEDAAPIPLLLDAVELRRTGDLRAAAIRMWPQAREAVEALLAARGVPIVLLIDRLDEVADAAFDARVVRMCDEHEGRLDAVIVTTRSSYRPALGEHTALQLPRWTEADVRRFLDALPSPVDRTLRRLFGERAMVRELLTNPLSATILALLGEEEVENLEHPVDMFRALIGKLFQGWARRRERPPTWEACAPFLLQWALETSAGERSGIERAALRRLVRSEHPDASEAVVDDLELGLGVLIPRGDCFEFLFRSLAEHLAGRRLAEEGIAVILDAAREPWAQEVIHHAAGCLKGAAARTELLSGLLVNEEADVPGVCDDHLRPVLAAIDVATDAPAVEPAVAERLTRAAARRIAEEYSNWVGDEVARRVPRLVVSEGTIGEQLTASCLEILLPPADGFALPGDRAGLRALLHHRDSTVCRAAIVELRAALDDTGVQADLLRLIHDGRSGGFDRDIAVEAALALRAVPRARLDPEVKARLIALLEDIDATKPFVHARVRAGVVGEDGEFVLVGERGGGPRRVIASCLPGREQLDLHVDGESVLKLARDPTRAPALLARLQEQRLSGPRLWEPDEQPRAATGHDRRLLERPRHRRAGVHP